MLKSRTITTSTSAPVHASSARIRFRLSSVIASLLVAANGANAHRYAFLPGRKASGYAGLFSRGSDRLLGLGWVGRLLDRVHRDLGVLYQGEPCEHLFPQDLIRQFYN